MTKNFCQIQKLTKKFMTTTQDLRRNPKLGRITDERKNISSLYQSVNE